MSVVARAATPSDLARIVPLLDQQFIFGKGREISFARRFPAVYCAENAGNIFLLEENAGIVSVLASKRFTLLDDGGKLRGAMIGAVYTRLERRGEGHASRLLEHATDFLRGNKIDFAVLWTDQPAFYTRGGWIAADRGVLGECAGAARAAEPPGSVARISAHAADAAHIESIRRRWAASTTLRQPDDYRQLPPPAEIVEVLTWGAEIERAAYALVGNHGDSSILYELIGCPEGFSALWHAVRRGRQRILANDVSGSPSHRWLADNGVAWQAKPLAMWLPLSARTDVARIARWYIPYFDRI